jgi:hypothetical protein
MADISRTNGIIGLGEFQINFTNRNDLATLLNDPSADLLIHCEFSLHSNERAYISDHRDDLVRQSIWRTTYPELYAWSTFTAVPLAAHLRSKEPEIQEQMGPQLESLAEELAADRIVGEFSLKAGAPHVQDSKVLEIVFGTFRPHYLVTCSPTFIQSRPESWVQ